MCLFCAVHEWTHKCSGFTSGSILLQFFPLGHNNSALWNDATPNTNRQTPNCPCLVDLVWEKKESENSNTCTSDWSTPSIESSSAAAAINGHWKKKRKSGGKSRRKIRVNITLNLLLNSSHTDWLTETSSSNSRNCGAHLIAQTTQCSSSAAAAAANKHRNYTTTATTRETLMLFTTLIVKKEREKEHDKKKKKKIWLFLFSAHSNTIANLSLVRSDALKTQCVRL